MKKFQFSLEVLLGMRTRTERSIKNELAHKNRELFQAQQQLWEYNNTLLQLQQEQKSQRQSGDADLFSMRHTILYRNKLKLDMLKKGEEIHHLQNECDTIKKRLIKATQQKRALELVKEKKHQHWMKQNKIQEQVFIDEVSQQGFIRNHRTAQNPSME